MINLTNVDMFNRKVLNSKGLKIVRFCAEWSGPCHIMAPIIKEMQSIYGSSATFYKVDIDKVPILKKNLGVMEIPTIYFFNKGIIIDHIIGLVSRQSLLEKLDNAIK